MAASDTSPDDIREMTWKSHPWAEEPPARGTTLLALVMGFSALGGYVFGDPWVGILSFGVLLGSLSRYFFSTNYVLTSDGLRISHLGFNRKHTWGRFRRVALRPEGVFLGTFDRPKRLDVFRGCYLRCPRQRQEVYDYVKTRITVAQAPQRD